MSTTTAPDGCAYCGGYHATLCPRVAEIEYHPDGTVKHVKLRAASGMIYGIRDGYPAGHPNVSSITSTLPANVIWYTS